MIEGKRSSSLGRDLLRRRSARPRRSPRLTERRRTGASRRRRCGPVSRPEPDPPRRTTSADPARRVRPHRRPVARLAVVAEQLQRRSRLARRRSPSRSSSAAARWTRSSSPPPQPLATPPTRARTVSVSTIARSGERTLELACHLNPLLPFRVLRPGRDRRPGRTARRCRHASFRRARCRRRRA